MRARGTNTYGFEARTGGLGSCALMRLMITSLVACIERAENRHTVQGQQLWHEVYGRVQSECEGQRSASAGAQGNGAGQGACAGMLRTRMV